MFRVPFRVKQNLNKLYLRKATPIKGTGSPGELSYSCHVWMDLGLNFASLQPLFLIGWEDLQAVHQLS